MGNIARNSSSFIGVFNGKILILKRSENDNIEAGKWCFPGGSCDDGEGFEDSFKREIKEEIGIDIENFNFFKSYFIDDNKRYGVRSVYFEGVLDGEKLYLNEEHSKIYFFDMYEDDLDHFDFAFNQREVIEEFIKYYKNKIGLDGNKKKINFNFIKKIKVLFNKYKK